MQDLFIKDAKSFKNSSFYPRVFAKSSQLKYLAVVGIGANVGRELWNFKKLLVLFMKDKRLKLLKSSPILVNKAFGFLAQKDFKNAVIMVATSLHARAFLKLLLYYEFKFRRKRSFKNAPRVLDLDLLYFSQKSRKSSFCTLPHPGVSERISVILPLGMVV